MLFVSTRIIHTITWGAVATVVITGYVTLILIFCQLVRFSGSQRQLAQAIRSY